MKDHKTYKIVLTGGGSGGHITPTAAVAKSIRAANPDARLHYIGSVSDGIAKETFKQSDLVDKYSATLTGKFRRFVGFTGFQKLKLWKSFLFNVRDFFGLLVGCVQAFFILVFNRPNIVFSKGGSPALPVCVAAIMLRIPIVTHDSDAVPGLTHRYVGKHARLRLFGVKPAQLKPNWRYVGIPLSPVFSAVATSTETDKTLNKYKLSKDFVLVTGGGLGSRDVNYASIDAAALDTSAYDWLIVTGKKYHEPSQDRLSQLPEDIRRKIHLVEFSSDMPDLIRAANIVVTRAGATALAEVSVAGAASIIIPNPLLPGGHQTHNALVYKNTGAAIVLTDEGNSIRAKDISDAVSLLTSDHKLKSGMQKSIKKLAVTNSADKVAEIVLKALEE